jgi:guanine deaminase
MPKQDHPIDQRAIRGRVLSFTDDPALSDGEDSYAYWEDGVVVVEGGTIITLGEANAILPELPSNIELDDHSGRLVLPGFIDTHIHYSQSRIIASYGAQLIEWLEKYTFPEEARFADPDYAASCADFFFDELLRNGTTTAAVYCTVHEGSVETFFAEAERRNMRMIAGKVMMDRNAPDALLDRPGADGVAAGFAASERLARKWHNRGRQHYAVTPRFALTSTEAQLEACKALVDAFPGAYLQTHLAEQRDEVEAVSRQFPQARNYTDVYDRAGLLGPRAIFGHGIHLGGDELRRLHETQSVIAFAPSSNLFIGSGLFDLERVAGGAHPVRVGLASDVGAGTSFSMLRTAADGYKVMQLQGQNLTALRALYLMTLGNARALGLERRVGTLEPGSEADIVVLDGNGIPALKQRLAAGEGDLAGDLFAFMVLGDERAVAATYIAGSPVKLNISA